MFGVSAAADETQAQVDLKRADWSVNAPHDLAHNPPSEEAVRSFIGHMTNKVCDPHFADLKHNGTLSLVLADDGGGTADCNYTEIFDKSGGRVEEYELDRYLDTPGVEDIDGDGHFEVIVDDVEGRENCTDDYGTDALSICSTCTEYWPRVYAWTGSGYTEVSFQYLKYYERELVSLKKQIASIYAAEAAARRPAPAPTPMQVPLGMPVASEAGHEISMVPQNSTGSFGGGFGQGLVTAERAQGATSAQSPEPQAAETPDPSDSDCLKAEAAKIERFIGKSKDAGMRDVIEWANSNDPAQRDFATGVLSDIGTAEALKYEKTLSRDSDPDVAKSAKSELDDWGKAETPDTFELQDPVQLAPNPADQSAKSGQSQAGAGEH